MSELAEALAAHSPANRSRYACACNEVLADQDLSHAAWEALWIAHLAAVVQPLIDTARADALRQAADDLAMPQTLSRMAGASDIYAWLRERADRIEAGR